jgi:RND superfamily putative drug exporter
VEALSSWVARHRLLVGLLWLAVTVLGVVIAPSVSGRLQSGVNLDSPAYTANQQIARHYGGATSAPRLVTINLPAGQTVRTWLVPGPTQPGFTRCEPTVSAAAP